jgi:hypothetical protein
MLGIIIALIFLSGSATAQYITPGGVCRCQKSPRTVTLRVTADSVGRFRAPPKMGRPGELTVEPILQILFP